MSSFSVLKFRLSFLLSLFIASQTFVYSQENPYEADTISLKVPSEGNKLDVTVLKPRNAAAQTPAIVFLVGSRESAWRKNYRTFVQFYLEPTFLKAGYTLVYFDKRGIGGSEGVWYNAGFETRALDARNVAVGVAELGFIDKSKIFVIGHSQGGWITQVAVSSFPDVFAGGVSMAGPTFNVRTQLINDYYSQNLCKGMDKKKALRKAKRKVRRDLLLVSLAGKGNPKQLKVIKNFTPEPYLRTVSQPLLLMFGENDPLVKPSWCMEELNRIFPGGMPANIETSISPGEDHSFRKAPLCLPATKQRYPDSVESRELMLNWVEKTLREKSRSGN